MSILPQTTYIYVLIDPRDGAFRYVGKANIPERRLRAHINHARMGNADHKSRWIAAVLRAGLRPLCQTLEECNYSVWKERECHWIAKMRADGHDLTNAKDGGDGFDPDESTRVKMSAAKRGKAPHNKGKTTSDEARAKQSAAAKRKFACMSEQERQHATAHLREGNHSHPGWSHSEAARTKISASLAGNQRTKGKPRSPEAVRKSADGNRGHVVTEETRRKIGEANRAAALKRKEQL